MNAIKFQDLKVGDSKNPIEALLQQTGWSLEEALLRLADYKSRRSTKDSKNPDVKTEVKEEISDYYNLFISENKREDESDSDVEIIEIKDYIENDKKDDAIVTKSSGTPIEEVDLTSKSTVIDTISVSDKSENNCEVLKSDTDNLKQINNTKVKIKLKVENLSIKHKKQSILKKYKCLRKRITKREIEKAEKKAAEVRKRLKLQLELLREKKKPNLKFLCSQPESNAQNFFENPSLEHSNSVVDENVSKEECTAVLETGDSDFMIIDVIGGYESPDREQTNYDLEDYSNEKEIGFSENSSFLDQDQLSKTTSKLKMCDYIKNLMDSEMEKRNENVYGSNENRLLEDDDSNKSNQIKSTSKLKICENILQSLTKYDNEMKVLQNSNQKASTSTENQLLEDDDSDKSVQSRTSKLKLCENIMQFNKTKSTGNFLRNLSEFSKPVGNAIIPTKTKDITKIKGWKNKLFAESNEKKSALSKDNSFPKLQKENVLRHKSVFISEQLDRLLSNAPQFYQAASGIQESTQSIINTTDNFTAPSASTSNIIDPSTSNISNIPTTASTTFPISTSPTELINSNSSTSTVSTIPTFASVPSVSSSNSTPVLSNTDVPSTSSTFDGSLKPYKPKTLAEKRRLLEASRCPLNAKLMYSMGRKERQENYCRIMNYRSQLVANEIPFDRESYKISSDITNTYSYIVCNGKRLKVASSKTDEILANIKNRKKMSRVNYNQPRSKISQIANTKKPSLLKSLKEEPKVVEWDSTEWETVEMKLPKVFLSVVPQYGQVIHPKFEHLIRNETCFLSENRVKFALSLLRTKNLKSKLHTFKFPLSYENNQETIKLKRKISVVDKTEDKVTESDDAIQQGVKSVMDKLLNYVDVLDETEHLHTNYENVECSTDAPILTVSTVVRPIKRQSGPRSKINKTALEMKRLNCQIVSVVNDEDNADNEKCTKEVCKLGCICKTLRCDSKNLLPIHCGSWKCIFKCSCKNNSNMDKTSLPVGYNLLNAGVINRLQDQAKKNLAKVEKEFTQTIIKTNNQLIMVGDSRDRRRRVTKTPKKYNDFLNEDLSDTVESDHHQWSDDEALPASLDDIKPCSVPLTKYNLNDIIPYCMIHSMYKCACISKSDCGISDVHLVPSIPSVVNHSSKTRSPQKPEFPKADAEKKQIRYKAAPRPANFVKPRPKYVRKLKNNKTFNKEEFCSRTRGLSSPYYIPRNTAESYLDKTLKSSKRLHRDLYRYVRSLRVKLNELRRTSEVIDPIQAKREDMERQLLLQTIDRLSPYLRGEAHLDSLISRLNQRMNGIITPESMRRKHPCESPSVINADISEDTPEKVFPSTNLNAITNCYTDSKTVESLDQAASSPQNKIQEKYMSSSKQNEFRLLPWTSLQNNYNKKALEIWYLNTNKISPIIITQRNRRPSVNHCNIRIFEQFKDEACIPLDFIRCIVHKQIPMNKNPDNIFVILAFSEKHFSELYSVCEKSSKRNNLNDKIRVSLLQEIRETSLSKDIDIESVPKETTDEVKGEAEQEEEILQGDFHHCDMQNEKKLINYFVRQFEPHTLYYDSGTPAFFDSRRTVSLPLPREVIRCKWRLIYVDQIFSYLRLTLNNFTIKYSDLMKVVELAQKKRKTVFLASESIRKGYSLKMFGLFCVPTYLDKIFVGPYLPNEGHHIDILNTNVANEMGLDVTNGIWVNQIENYQNCTDLPSVTESCIDLTEDEDLKTILKNWNCNNLLKILGFSSSLEQNEDIGCATDYEEDTYWNELNNLMKGIDFGKSSNKSDNEVIEKHYYSLKHKCTVRYFITNIPGLGYIKAFLHEVTNIVDIMCPLTNQIKRFPNYGSAVNGITRILIQNVFLIPLANGLKIKMMAKLNPTMKTVLSSTVLDGYHIAGSCGVKNIRHSNKEDLKKLGLTEYEVDLVIEHRNKRQIYDLTNQLARSLSLESISNKRPHGDVLTEVIKKIISTIKLSTAGSSIKNIENSFELINLYPASVKTKIYKQLEYVAFNFNKKELSTAELQKIRISPQKRKSTSPISPARSSSNAFTELEGFQKIRLYPQTKNVLNFENQTEGSTSNVASEESGNFQFQRIKLSKNGKLGNCNTDVELKPISCKDMKFKDIRRSLPNEKFVVSTAPKKPNLSPNDVIITKLNRLHCFGTTVVSNKEKKIKSIEDDVIIIEPEPTEVQKNKPTSLLRNQKQPELKKRNSQLEDNVVIQPEPKRLKMNVANDVTIQPELKNHIRQLGNGTISPSKNAVLQNNIVVAQTKSSPQKRLQVLLANGNTTSLLKGKYINLLPLKQDGENKYVILPNKDSGSPLQQNIDVSKFKRAKGLQKGNQVLVTSQNGKSLLVPQSSNVIKFPVHRKTVKILPKEESHIKLPINKTNTVSVPKAVPLSNSIPANKKQNTNLSELKNLLINEDKSSSSFITIQSGETTQCFKVLNKNMDSVKNMITGQVVRPPNCQSNKLNSEEK